MMIPPTPDTPAGKSGEAAETSLRALLYKLVSAAKEDAREPSIANVKRLAEIFEQIIAAVAAEQRGAEGSLHQRILNLPCEPKAPPVFRDNFCAGYSAGHRDARHAAAELLLSANTPGSLPPDVVGRINEIERWLKEKGMQLIYQRDVEWLCQQLRTSIASEQQMREQVNAKYWEQIRSDNANLNKLLRERDSVTPAVVRLPPDAIAKVKEIKAQAQACDAPHSFAADPRKWVHELIKEHIPYLCDLLLPAAPLPAGDEAKAESVPALTIRFVQPGDNDSTELVTVTIREAVRISRAAFKQAKPDQEDSRTDIEAPEDYAVVHWAALAASPAARQCETPFRFHIKTTGDGAGIKYVTNWDEVISAMANGLYHEPTNDNVAEARNLLLDGMDDGEGWNGHSVSLNFEDGSIYVSLEYRPPAAPAPESAAPSTEATP
jgi:hypothetical protein